MNKSYKQQKSQDSIISDNMSRRLLVKEEDQSSQYQGNETRQLSPVLSSCLDSTVDNF